MSDINKPTMNMAAAITTDPMTNGVDWASVAWLLILAVVLIGELLAVIGSSGSGKTTLLQLIAGFEIASRGSIMLDGNDITRLPVRGRQLGVVFQSYALFPHMTAWQNVAYPLKLRKTTPEKRQRLAFEALDRVGLKGFEERSPQTLSGGQQQRVALARALVNRPMLLRLDEPLSALDLKLRQHMRAELRAIQGASCSSSVHFVRMRFHLSIELWMGARFRLLRASWEGER